MNRRSVLLTGVTAAVTPLILPLDAEASATSPTYIAHRGASLLYPENTAQSIKQAYLAGADVGECDIRFGASGTPVLCHDPDIYRTTNATAHTLVSSLTWTQLNAYDWGYPKKFGATFAGTKPTGVWTVISLAKQYGRRILIEVKDTFTPATFDRLMKEIDAQSAVSYVILYSFIKSNVDMIRKLRPDIHVGLCEDTPPLGMMRTNASLATVGNLYVVSHAIVDVDKMSYWKAGGVTRWVWTLDDPTQWPTYTGMGASGIVTGNTAFQQWRLTH